MTTWEDPTPAPTAPTAPTEEFAVVRRGFDPEQVRAYIHYVHAEVERLAKDNWDLRGRLDAAEQLATNAEQAAARAEQLAAEARQSAASSAQTGPGRELAMLREELQRAMGRLEEVEAQRAQARNPDRGVGSGTTQSAGIAAKSKNGDSSPAATASSI